MEINLKENKMDKNNLIFFALIILIVIAVFFLVSNDSSTKDANRVQNPPEQKSNNPQSNVILAPEISGVTPDGKPLNIKDFKGKVVVVDFWASSCPPCRQYIPTLVDIYGKYKDKGLEIVGVYVDNRDRNLANMKYIKKQTGSTWSQIVGKGAFDAAQRYNVTGIPHIALIGKDGSLVMKSVRDRYNIEQLIVKELSK